MKTAAFGKLLRELYSNTYTQMIKGNTRLVQLIIFNWLQ